MLDYKANDDKMILAVLNHLKTKIQNIFLGI